MSIYNGLAENTELYNKAKKEILSKLPLVEIIYSNNEEFIGKRGYLIKDSSVINFLLGTNYIIDKCFCVMLEKITIVANDYNIIEVKEIKI